MTEKRGKSIVILYEVEHIGIILSSFGSEKLKEGSEFTLIPIDYEIELALRDKGLPFYSLAGYTARSSLKERAILVSSLMRQLYTNPEFNFFKYSELYLVNSCFFFLIKLFSFFIF